jgi:radical SAM superfamily enzyme with C-terminal helix-hairpin-helix motif
MYTILDCYTDEPSGLGVPPYLGTYPRYIYGYLLKEKKERPYYLTIDDLRLYHRFKSKIPETKKSGKTNIEVYNLTKNFQNIEKILAKTDTLIVILGVQTPGKYLSALPGTLKEIIPLIKDLKCKKILTGPAASFQGTQTEGGKFTERTDLSVFSEIKEDFIGIKEFSKLKDIALFGSEIINQIPDLRVIEIEVSAGCFRDVGCSFCTEVFEQRRFREQKDIYEEINTFMKLGCEYFRLGKQTCFYSYKNSNINEINKLLRPISRLKPKVLHIDNVNPVKVTEEITKSIVKYCTPGNVAAFGVESFDADVIKANNLNSNPEITMNAIRILNKYGAERGENGMPYFLPGVNILFGLNRETKKTHEENMFWFNKILDENLLVRRINIRQVVPFKGTKIYEEVGNKFLKKNKKYYWKWRDEIRQKIDFPMLKKIVPEGTILKDVKTEIYDGNTTFGRQIGSYPLIIGIEGRLELKKFHTVMVKKHMLRSITGKIV